MGPQAWKRFLHRPVETLWTMSKTENGVTIESGESVTPKFAFIGVRACELHAIAIQDRVFSARRLRGCGVYDAAKMHSSLRSIAAQAGGTCFCVSMQTGPKAEAGFDLALTELIDGDSHQFLVEVGSEAGAEILGELPHRAATRR